METSSFNCQVMISLHLICQPVSDVVCVFALTTQLNCFHRSIPTCLTRSWCSSQSNSHAIHRCKILCGYWWIPTIVTQVLVKKQKLNTLNTLRNLESVQFKKLWSSGDVCSLLLIWSYMWFLIKWVMFWNITRWYLRETMPQSKR